MGASSMILTAANIKTLVDDTALAVVDLNTTITEISTKFNAMLETSTGHTHDGTDSASVSMTINDMTLEEYALVQCMGLDL